MKKILFIIAVAGFTFTSCKKDRTCTCTMSLVSETVNGTVVAGATGSATSVDKLTKVTKSGAHCNSGDRTETQVSGANTTVDVFKADCKLS